MVTHGTHDPCRLPGSAPRALPLPQPPLLIPSLAPALLECIAVWKSEHRGLFRKSLVLQYSRYPYSLERKRDREKQDCVGRRGKCMGTAEMQLLMTPGICLLNVLLAGVQGC